MTDSTTLVSFGLAVSLLVMIPGPATLYIVTRSLDGGKEAGLASVLGISTGAMVHFFAAGLGLSAVLATSATAFSTVKYAGALYLIYLGIQKILSSSDDLVKQPKDANYSLFSEESISERSTLKELTGRRKSLSAVFLQGVVVSVLNPKAAIFFLAFLPQFLDPAAGPIWQQLIPLSAVFVCIGLAGDGTYALVAGKLRRWLTRNPLLLPAFWKRQKYVTGGTYIALGLAAATVTPSQK